MKMMLVAIVVFLAIVGCKEKASIEPVSVAEAASASAAPTRPPAPPPVAAATVKKSLCSELDGWTKDLVDSSMAVEQVLPRYKARNQDANGAMELLKVSGDFRKETAAKGEALRQRIANLEALDLDPKETQVRDQLLKGFNTTATVFGRFSGGLWAGN